MNFNLPTAYVCSASVQSLLVSTKCSLRSLLHALSESSSGYVWDLLVYAGKTGHDPEKGVTYHVVMKLLQELEGNR